MKAQHGLQDSTDIIIVEHSQYAYCCDPGSRSDCPVSCSHYFVGFCLLGLASVCFPGPRKEMVEIGIALITQLREYLPFLNVIFEVDYGKTSSDFELIKGSGCGS